MNRNLTALSIAGSLLIPTFLAGGCASQNQSNPPYALTGPESQAQADQHEAWRQQLAYTDQKGKYRPEFANREQPIGYSQ
ncbi:MAG TPA: hypothetical protein VGI81_01145 [Tepidisphaeraceae bacterium]|jgi:hypothetical protein